MKKEIHPPYHKVKAKCACGAIFEVGSSKEAIEVEICSSCHPFYSGKEKLVDTAGRVNRFKKLEEKKAKIAPTKRGKTVKRMAKKAKKSNKV